MNEKMKDIAIQLQEECRKEGVSLLCTMQKKERANVIVLGNIMDIGICLAAQERHLDKELPIPTRTLRSAAIAAEDAISNEVKKTSSHTFIINDLKDIPDILDRIIRGDLT